jgi:hypothetical protein
LAASHRARQPWSGLMPKSTVILAACDPNKAKEGAASTLTRVCSVLVQDYRCSGGWAQKRVFAISTMDMRVA